MTNTGTWQVWDCGDLVATLTDPRAADELRADLLDQEFHDWPQLVDLTTRCICVVHIAVGPPERPMGLP